MNLHPEIFLSSAFKALPQGARPWVAGFRADPYHPKAHWGGSPVNGRIPDFIEPKANCYLAVSSFKAGADGRIHRRKDNFAALHLVMVDDVGTKVPVGAITLDPSYLLETSPGNHQAGYLLSEPVTDRALAESVIDALVAQGLATAGKDPGMKGVTRYGRLPVGINNKPALVAEYGQPFKVQLREWEPERRYTIQEIIAAYGLKLGKTGAAGPAHEPYTPPADDPLLDWLAQRGQVQGPAKDSGWIPISCPWIDEHTDRTDTGAAYLPGRGFQCHHGHCESRTLLDLRAWAKRHGWETFDNFAKGGTKGGTSYFEGYTGYKDTSLNDKENTCNPREEERVTKVTTPRPYYFMIHLDGHKEGGFGLETEVLDEGDPRKPGLWYVGTQKEMTPEGETIVHSEPVWVSVPFEILATADDGRGHGYCIAVRFQALHGHRHTWPIPRALLVTEGHEILHRLYEMGFKAMDRPAKANDHLRSYLNRAIPERRALAVSKTGWADSRFVLPDRVFGADPESVFYQVDDPRPSPYTVKGTPAGWRDLVAKVIEPYDLPVFAVSCAFAAPLLSLLDIQSGGFHFMGTSTTGKTTAQNWGLSVWGKPKDLRHNWHGTKVGFELTAAAHSDTVLMLDEIGQADPREVGDLIYMVFNEAGRMRGNARLTHRSLPRWQLLLLSSGEKSLQQLMQDVGKTPMAGQELRLLHIHADAGDGCGILNGLTGAQARVELINQVNAAVIQHHGHPIQTYLARLAHPDTLARTSEAAQTVKSLTLRFTNGSTSDEAKRAATRFALAGFAGELASNWGITGWPAGRATQAAECLFHRWLDQWGAATRHDETTFLEHLDAWLSGNSTGHFAEVDPVTRELTMNAERALTSMRPFYGYVANGQDGRVFYLNAAGWQAMTKGFARSLVIETLAAAGRLEKDPKSNKGKQMRVGDRCANGRYYVIREAGHVE